MTTLGTTMDSSEATAGPPQLGAIFSLYREKCIPGFNTLCTVLKDHKGDADSTPKDSLPLVVDQLGRLQAWAAHSGAHRVEASKLSLDYRLREASHMRSRVSGLLAELDHSLHQGK